MSRVYRALLFRGGIPSRYCTGGVIEENNRFTWHVWTELYLEKYGWIPADPSYHTDDGGYFGFINSGWIFFNRGEYFSIKGAEQKYTLHTFQMYAKYYWITSGTIKGFFDYAVKIIPSLVKESEEKALNCSDTYLKELRKAITDIVNEKRDRIGLIHLIPSEILDTIASEHLDKILKGEKYTFDSSFRKHKIVSGSYFYNYRIYGTSSQNRETRIIEGFSDEVLLSVHATDIGVGYSCDSDKDQHHMYVIIAKIKR
jgi:hypothetical protein